MQTMSTRRTRRLIAAMMAAILTIGAVPATTALAASYTLTLADQRDWVQQTNFVQCVGASMQMMVNMIRSDDDRTARTQVRLQDLAREWSGVRPANRERQGASVRGWAAGLNILGVGPYKLVGEDTIEAAMHTAATAIAETGKPVGLLVWRGRHAWVMSGFQATADPATTADFAVTRAMIHDPLYPHGSSVWGPSPKPGQALTLAVLGKQYVPRRMGSFSTLGQPPSGLGGKYVLVLPYEPDLEATTTAIR
jgi:hypothetical protein